MDVRDVEVARVPAEIRAEPERHEELQLVREPVGEVGKGPDIEKIARARGLMGYGARLGYGPRRSVACVGGADRHPMTAPGKPTGEAGDSPWYASVGPSLLVVGGDLYCTQHPAYFKPRSMYAGYQNDSGKRLSRWSPSC